MIGIIMINIEIVIPAYNESKNLSQLLDFLSSQAMSTTYSRIKKIVVISDASTDETASLVCSKMKTIPSLTLKNNRKRKGKAKSLISYMKETSADILVVLDADITIIDPQFLEKITKPIVEGRADLTSPLVLPQDSHTWVGKMISSSVTAKNKVYISWNEGNNIYMCHGRARAFSRRLYLKMDFKQSANEDSYSFLKCLVLGYVFKCVKSTSVMYKLPETISDHLSQSQRFFVSLDNLRTYFDSHFLDSQFKLPKSLLLYSFIFEACTHPIYMVSYTFLTLYSVFFHKREAGTKLNTWNIARTTK